MDISAFTSPNGQLVRAGLGEPSARAFVPAPLPPNLAWTNDLVSLVSASDRAIGQLNSAGDLLPNPHLLIRPFMRREAVQSSRIEGTRTSVDELYLFEASTGAVSDHDADEVHNYLEAFEYGLERCKTLPLSRRLLCEMHGVLMSGVRGQERRTGEFRKQQNWIGPPGSTIDNATFVPPPPPEMNTSLDALEAYLNTPSALPPLVRLAMVHYQFEAIHPFEDGNGRIGRLLVSLALCMDGVLSGPLLYISDALERRRSEYYHHLFNVSATGNWEAWISFFLQCATAAAQDGAIRARRLITLHEAYRQRFAATRSSTVLPLVNELFITPVATIPQIATRIGVTQKSARRTMDALIEEGLVRELTGNARNRVYVAQEIMSAIGDPMIA